jgi:cobaltochelatase CobS
MAAAMAQLLAVMTPPSAPQLDEAAIKAAVEKYANPVTTLKIDHTAKGEPTKTVTIKGAHKELERVVKRLNAGYKVYLYGPAGAGKTTLAEQAAKSLNLEFAHTGALLSKHELTGYQDAQGRYISSAFYDAYKNGKLFLFDEIDGSTPTSVIAFNGAIENGQMTFPHEVVYQHPNFRVIAAANTNGLGPTANYKRSALDGATLDRFKRIELQYDEKLELRLALAEYARLDGTNEQEAKNWVKFVQQTRKKALKCKIEVIISPRSSIGGAGILAMGDPIEMAIAETFGASLSADQKRQLDIAA